MRRQPLVRLVTLPPLEGTNGEVRAGLDARRRLLARLGARAGSATQQRSASWWIAHAERPLDEVLASLQPHPPAALCVIAARDGAVPRLAESLLRAQAPAPIDVFRAVAAPGDPDPELERAALAAGIRPTREAARPLDAALGAQVIVATGPMPPLSEAFRGKRIHFLEARQSAPPLVVGELSEQARCLVAEYRARVHRSAI